MIITEIATKCNTRTVVFIVFETISIRKALSIEQSHVCFVELALVGALFFPFAYIFATVSFITTPSVTYAFVTITMSVALHCRGQTLITAFEIVFITAVLFIRAIRAVAVFVTVSVLFIVTWRTPQLVIPDSSADLQRCFTFARAVLLVFTIGADEVSIAHFFRSVAKSRVLLTAEFWTVVW
jgi:hypothetical protein